jgi:hypothetical protein
MPYQLELNQHKDAPLGPDEKSVYNERTGENIIAPVDMPDADIAGLFSQDPLSAIAEQQPTLYKEKIAPVLLGNNFFNPGFTSEAFLKNTAMAATFHIYKPSPAEQVAFQTLSPVASTAGQFTGFIAPAIATSGIADLVGAGLVEGGAVLGSRIPAIAKLITGAAEAESVLKLKMGVEAFAKSEKVLEAGVKTAASMFQIGVANKVFDDVHAGKPIDYGKIAKESGQEAIPWALTAGIGASIAKPLVGMLGKEAAAQIAKEMALTGGSMFLIQKSQGADDLNSWLGAAMAMVFHSFHTADDLASRQLHIETSKMVFDQYIRESNGVIDPNLSRDAAESFVESKAKEVLSEEEELARFEGEGGPSATEPSGKPVPVDQYHQDLIRFEGEGGAVEQVLSSPNLSKKLMEKLLICSIDPEQDTTAPESKPEVQVIPKLVVAAKTSKGEILSGKPGDMHGDLVDRHPDFDFTKKKFTEGFVDENGKFYNRKQAFKLVKDFVKNKRNTKAVEAGELHQAEYEDAYFENKKELASQLRQVDNLEGTGETKKSGLAESVTNEAINKGLVEDLGGLPEYKMRDMDLVSAKVAKFIKKNFELAKKIAFGEAPEQDGLRAQEIFTGLRAKAMAEGDIQLIHDLAHNEYAADMATELGQRVKALDSRNPLDPTERVREVSEARSAKAKKASAKEVPKDVKKMKAELEKAKPKASDWENFIKELAC